MHYDFMKLAIEQAQNAHTIGEVPVGAVIVKDNQVIGTGFNLCESKACALRHAEINAIEKASEFLKDWRLYNCDIYVTLEPCPMCAGAILNARIRNLYFGAYDYHYGACGSRGNVLWENKFIHNVKVYGGIMEPVCSALLKEFFKNIR